LDWIAFPYSADARPDAPDDNAQFGSNRAQASLGNLKDGSATPSSGSHSFQKGQGRRVLGGNGKSMIGSVRRGVISDHLRRLIALRLKSSHIWDSSQIYPVIEMHLMAQSHQIISFAGSTFSSAGSLLAGIPITNEECNSEPLQPLDVCWNLVPTCMNSDMHEGANETWPQPQKMLHQFYGCSADLMDVRVPPGQKVGQCSVDHQLDGGRGEVVVTQEKMISFKRKVGEDENISDLIRSVVTQEKMISPKRKVGEDVNISDLIQSVQMGWVTAERAETASDNSYSWLGNRRKS